MRIALVTTPLARPTAAGLAFRGWVPVLRELAEVDVFVPDASQAADGECREVPADVGPERPVGELAPRQYEQILYTIGNEAEHAFMLPMVRALGGTVALFSWSLTMPSVAAHPELVSGGLRGAVRAWREGGGEALSRGWAGLPAGGAEQPAGAGVELNRSVVRHADAFLVDGEELRARILESRNAPTPIAVGQLDARQLDRESSLAAAREWMQRLERFPRPRASRRALITLALQRGLEEARARRESGRESASEP